MSRINTAMEYGLAGLVLLCLPTWSWAQGSLTPPGPPAPMMRTLSQIEPRTPLSILGGKAGVCKILIDKPGSYYLTGNIIGVSGLAGIQITTDSVSLDLNGFSLLGVAGSHKGIQCTTVRRTVVRNGSICHWGSTGLEMGFSARLENLNVEENGLNGIMLATGGIVADCTISNNEGSGVILAGGSILKNSNIIGNKYAGVRLYDYGGLILHCLIQANETDGIVQDFGGVWRIEGNVISENKSEGIRMLNQNLILNNLVSGAGSSATGIAVDGANRVEGNQVTLCATGIWANDSQGKNVVVNNSCIGNTVKNYSGTGNANLNSFGPLGTTAAATNPYGNISIP